MILFLSCKIKAGGWKPAVQPVYLQTDARPAGSLPEFVARQRIPPPPARDTPTCRSPVEGRSHRWAPSWSMINNQLNNNQRSPPRAAEPLLLSSSCVPLYVMTSQGGNAGWRWSRDIYCVVFFYKQYSTVHCKCIFIYK